ncbi:reticulon-4-interacting protein 1, mitochondrial [Manduca sexta]|uniref:reticulon-4-interacting protein 1, mitochondrial n=1 Tax=Manduca sexta TaxID=7130 RepID=UPI00188E7523|nr:reticulon-4-interacting protein 1, mitochondrial [Manduca sexta]XP_037294691.1 reticulon-4-interacting protein 1, mitochondrial [Manduca sexta]
MSAVVLRAAARCTSSAAGGRMRAWRVHGYEPAEPRLEEARVPALRAPDELLVRVHAASVNPLDVAMLGGYGARVLNTLRAAEGGEGVEFPLVPGRDFVGVVERAGAAARLRRGERVWGVVPPHRQGTHAQYVVVRDSWAGPAPRALADAAAAGALYAGLTACGAVRAAAPRPRARVLLLGLGGVGHAALQLLVRERANVVVGCSPDLCARALQLGAVDALDRLAPDYDAQLERAGPFDAIVDCAGLGGWEASARRWRFGRYVTLTTPLLREADERGLGLGFASAALSLLAQNARACSAQSARPPGAAVWAPPHVRWVYFMPRAADIELLRRLAEAGQFSVCVERVYAWAAAREAYARAAGGGARGKLVLDFTDPTDPTQQ